ncbi:MAG TPA: PTS system mannose/fructose/sorbose family transporter subunit IID [Dinghuibacter sp.]|uniref:PTS system mannose/fructose/sorbose family transporter subunit IID n=1 Tax=Dinghuibacter sp. TaxID=2024697 RepID=UPI002C8FB18D|nr:PTS system mannose/fructose/sorbose family transporter subunit IID [Dinghuibacter sp.]HTJ10883.1 PTS system mannose/fructose/sorbose family transporter subunit IID [Dinghuibacter sp.]
MSTASIIWITLIAVLGHSEDFLGTTLLSRPLVLAPLVGAALGDVHAGIVMGATLELIFMGNIKVGAAIPPDVITGGVLGTAFAITSGKGAAIALALAVPISILAEMLLSWLFVTRSVFNKAFARAAASGDWKRIQTLHVASGLLKPLLMGTVVCLSLLLGAGAMKSLLDLIPAWLNTGLVVAGNVLPALGFALLLNLMFRQDVAPYFFLGFILASYLHLPMIAIGGLGIIVAMIVTGRDTRADGGDPGAAGHNGRSDGAAAAHVLGAREIRAVFWRSMALEANFNFETWQNTGVAFALVPVLRLTCPDRASMARALERHLQFFNTSPYGSTLILGITAAMEEQRFKDPDFDEESINAVKLGLMGPLAGVFDSLFWGTLKVIAAGVGTSLALKGSLLGPLLFLAIFNVPHLALRYRLTFTGYRAGMRFLQRLQGSHVMDRLTQGASILGLMVVGAMPATLMTVGTPLRIGEGVTLQSVLDQVAPGLIPLGLTFLVYAGLKRHIKTSYLLVGLLALGFCGSLLHILN